MVNGMNTVHIWLWNEQKPTQCTPFYEFNVKYDVWAIIYKEKKILWLLPGYTIALPDEKQP